MRDLACLLLVVLATPFVFAQDRAPNFHEWIDGPEAYFATNQERVEWQRVLSRDDADHFIEAYWRKRGEQFKKDVISRIERADELFPLPGLRGSLTPRGRVWIILGSPTRTEMQRSNTLALGLPDIFQNNSIERGAIVSTRWVYRPDRLPKAAGFPELVVDFQSNTLRGQEIIENQGLVEPYLTRVVEYYANHPVIGGSTMTVAEDSLWKAAENLSGSFFEGDSYIAANDKTFYALSFYVPATAKAFADVKSVLLVALVRNERGEQVAATRDQFPLLAYGKTGDRYVDRSLTLPPGNYTATFALFTPEGSSLLANRKATFLVPASADSGISQIMPTAFIEALPEKQMPYDPFTFVATKYAVKGDHRFAASDRPGFFVVISNPPGEPQPSMLMTLRIRKAGTLLHQTKPAPASLTQTGPHTWLVGPVFEPGTFTTGDYDIELQLTDATSGDGRGNGYTTRTQFHVD